ncbi:dioxygenase family protein [Peribacillus asahii]|uniref:dioxygenase family protein n=1 Tax=Peribacillus asahii TaxID=228899 RepID=UPI002079634F|nr:class III extradiol ring-cleavage dioxygenase [Peribacillus asahii]USK58354.1 dioxygenase [Peribacillus asahii]USK68727.1 dioxygenase [Peribacillus asahii]
MRPSLFLSHGTPWLTIEDNRYTEFLKEYVAQHERPDAIVIISSHWNRCDQAVSAVKKHDISCDFIGHPDKVTQITYPAAGNIELSDQVLTLLSRVDIFGEFDENRPLDYGSWVPLHIMYPEADIPVVSLSINPTLSLAKQYEIGKSLAALKEENVLIIASGGIVYNLDHIQYEMNVVEGWAIRFVEWIEKHVMNWNLKALFQFQEEAPFAFDAVPNISELIPLIIAMGTGDKQRNPTLLHRSFQFGNVSLSAFEF